MIIELKKKNKIIQNVMLFNIGYNIVNLTG